jgi:tetratricopeptide (TPR) repeat protein
MPNFIWTAKDRQGKPIVKEVSAETIEESRAMLLAEGYTDLELKSDEIGDVARRACASINKDRKSRPEEFVRHLGNTPQTTLGIILKRIAQNAIFYLLMIALMALAVFRGHKTNAIVAGIVTVGWFVFRIWMSLPQIYYAKLNKAKDWYRWTEVLQILKSLERIQHIHPVKLPATELIRARAQALAGLGRLSDALIEVQKSEDQHGVPSWLYKAQLAGIYSIAKDYDKSLEYGWEALEEKQTSVLYLDQANRLLRYKKDTVKAKEILSKIDKDTLTEIAKPYYLRCQGILDYIEGDYASAREELEVSLKMMEQTRDRPFRDGNISVVKGYLCCVLAKQGGLTDAKKCFAEAREYLIATGETALLEECKRAVGE